MTYFDQDQRYHENESYRDEQPRQRERGRYREDRSFERAPHYEGEREFGRGPGGGQDREYRGGMIHHSSRPQLQRPYEGDSYGDGGGRSYQGEGGWGAQRRSNPWEERGGRSSRSGQEGRSFEQRGWYDRSGEESSRGFGGGGYRGGSGYGGGYGGGGFGSAGYGDSFTSGGGSFGSLGYGSSYGGGYSGGYSGSGYGDSYGGYGSSGGYGSEGSGREMQRGQGQRGWPGSYGPGSYGPGSYGQGSGRGQQEAYEGPHAGKGPKGFRRSDERLNEATCDCLERHSQLDASNIEVVCKDGIVTLKGTVESRREKRLAEEAAEGVYGVKDVMNELRVQKDSGSQSERSSSSRLDQSKQDSSSRTDSGSLSSSTMGASPKR